MNITHYCLGFAPYRSGGLTRYVYDLACQQIKDGHNVSILWPGRIRIYNSKLNYKLEKRKDGITSIELINPLPVPLLNGIQSIKEFMKPCDIDQYSLIFKEIGTEIFHVHTLMGIHKEAFDAAHNMNIKIYYTTHDYFGICPKVNLLDFNGQPCIERNSQRCAQCCKNALSLKKIKVLQSGFYRRYKNLKLFAKVRKYYKRKFSDTTTAENFICANTAQSYSALYRYYDEIFSKVDAFHFNSFITQRIFCNRLKNISYKVLSITNCSIKKNYKRKKNVNYNNIAIGYFSDRNEFKGYWFLLDVLDEIKKEYDNFKLKTFFGIYHDRDYSVDNEKFSPGELYAVLDTIDILVAPSICYETFGMVIIEALSRGVPVIATDRVGASYIIPQNGGIVLKPDKNAFIETISDLLENPKKIELMNKCLDSFIPKKIDVHSREIVDFYKEGKLLNE